MGLFLSQGFKATSVAQITEVADIGKGTFFTYFDTKQDVLSFLGEQVIEAMAEADDPAAPAPQRLRGVFTAAAQWFDANEDAARQMCIARLPSLGDSTVKSSRSRLLDLFAAIVGKGVRTGQLRPVDEGAAVTMIAAAYFVPVAQWTWDPDGPSLGSRLDGQLELALSALAE